MQLEHWFGLHPWDLEHLTKGELEYRLGRLKDLPLAGWAWDHVKKWEG